MDTATPAHLSERVRTFLEDGRLYPVIGTTGEDGEPHQAVIWYRLEADDRILVNSRDTRRWPADLRRDPRVSLAFMDVADPFNWVGVQALVDEIVDDVEQARDEIVELAVRYDEADDESVTRFRSQQRVSFRLRIVAVHVHLDE
jgi:PPOX class probable F420-dependent enzyme